MRHSKTPKCRTKRATFDVSILTMNATATSATYHMWASFLVHKRILYMTRWKITQKDRIFSAYRHLGIYCERGVAQDLKEPAQRIAFKHYLVNMWKKSILEL